jgi:hypothetical protein
MKRGSGEIQATKWNVHSLTAAIAAYDKALALLTALQQQEEFYTIIAECEFSERVAAAG